MATNVKKISELEKISSLSNSHNILIEENGRAKRIASSNIGGKVKTVNGVEPDENGNIEIQVGSEQVQADFAQNDPTQPDYVKNRTHWEENGLVALLPEMTVVIEGVGEGYVELSSSFDMLTAGQAYVVILDGVEYECIARAYEDFIIIGNGTLDEYGDGNEGNGEPFYCDSYPDGYIGMATVVGEHTVSIVGEGIIVHQLDEKFIPDSVKASELVVEIGDWTGYEDEDGREVTASHSYEEVVAALKNGRSVVLFQHDTYFRLDSEADSTLYFTSLQLVTGNYYRSIEGRLISVNSSGWRYVWKAVEIPTATEKHNGAFLRVENGSYALVNLTDVSTEGA